MSTTASEVMKAFEQFLMTLEDTKIGEVTITTNPKHPNEIYYDPKSGKVSINGLTYTDLKQIFSKVNAIYKILISAIEKGELIHKVEGKISYLEIVLPKLTVFKIYTQGIVDIGIDKDGIHLSLIPASYDLSKISKKDIISTLDRFNGIVYHEITHAIRDGFTYKDQEIDNNIINIWENHPEEIAPVLIEYLINKNLTNYLYDDDFKVIEIVLNILEFYDK